MISSGKKFVTTNKATGPPRMTPSVPVRNMISAFGPRLRMALKSILKQRRISEAGNKYRDATK